ncbi:F-box only protein 31 [Grus japonensis]|uniref:F-box only protein 31 n=1 Tax=Grus japonensis TaxID=30415 RepID=A0ABC9VTB6_GRUJA
MSCGEGEDSLHSSPAPAWSPSHRRQSSTSFSNASPSHGLQSFTNCSSVDDISIDKAESDNSTDIGFAPDNEFQQTSNIP